MRGENACAVRRQTVSLRENNLPYFLLSASCLMPHASCLQFEPFSPLPVIATVF